MKKVFLSLITICLFIISCNDNKENLEQFEDKDISLTTLEKDPNYFLKEEFSKALAKVLKHSKEARDLIKKEALKKIDHDYDVLFESIRETQFVNGNTFEDLLLQHLSEVILNKIKRQIPTLTIFVPTLPENSFSAELWETDSEIPEVAFRSTATEYTTIYDSNGRAEINDPNTIPGYPIVVVKENERIITHEAATKSGGIKLCSSIPTKSSTGPSLYFLDDVFDNINNIATKGREFILQPSHRKLLSAYDIFPNSTDWQRDNIYYNLSHSQTKGSFDLRFKEHIVGFEMLNDPKGAMNKVCDHTSDPIIDGKWHKRDYGSWYQMVGWTDGELEFRVKYTLGSKSPIGTEITTFFRVDPMHLFEVTAVKQYHESKKKFQIKEIKNLYYNMSSNPLPLFEWDIENYSTVIAISIDEYDPSETVQRTVSTSTKNATNFNYESSWGTKVKTGLKYGNSQETTHTVSYQTTTQTGSDELGTVIINFGDQIILNKDIIPYQSQRNGSRLNYNNKYYTSYYRIHIAPLETSLIAN